MVMSFLHGKLCRHDKLHAPVITGSPMDLRADVGEGVAYGNVAQQLSCEDPARNCDD